MYLIYNSKSNLRRRPSPLARLWLCGVETGGWLELSLAWWLWLPGQWSYQSISSMASSRQTVSSVQGGDFSTTLLLLTAPVPSYKYLQCPTNTPTALRIGSGASTTTPSRSTIPTLGSCKSNPLSCFRKQKGTIKAFDKFYSWFPAFLDMFPDEEAFLNFAFWFVIATIAVAVIASRWIKIKPHHL